MGLSLQYLPIVHEILERIDRAFFKTLFGIDARDREGLDMIEQVAMESSI